MQRQRLPASASRSSVRDRVRVLAQERLHRHQEAGRAEPALKRVRLVERTLERMQVAVRRREPLDRPERAAVRLDREHQAGPDGLAVELDGAGAAHALLAADLRASEPGAVPDEVRQERPRLDIALVRRAVDLDADPQAIASSIARRASSVQSARRCSSSTLLRRQRGGLARLSAVGQRALGRLGAHRVGARAEQRDAGVPTWSDDGRRARRREVAVRSRVLREAAAGAVRLLRHLDLHEQLVRLAGGVERAEEELGGVQRADRAGRAQMEARAERGQRRRQLGGRVRVRDRAAHRPAAADLVVPHEPDRLVQQRPALPDELGALERHLAGHRADPQRPALGADVVELRDPVDVDHELGSREAQVQQRNEALAAGEHGALEPEQR